LRDRALNLRNPKGYAVKNKPSVLVFARPYAPQSTKKVVVRKSKRDRLRDAIMALDHSGVRRLALKIFNYDKP
jgi:hypothetical protein